MNNILSPEFDDRITSKRKWIQLLILFAVAFAVTLPGPLLVGIFGVGIFFSYPMGLAWFFPDFLNQSLNNDLVLNLIWAMYILLLAACIRSKKRTTFHILYVILFVLVIANGIGCHLIEIRPGGM